MMHSCSKLKVLIIDDDPTARRFANTHLSQFYTILEAENGSSGIEVAKKEQPDIILLDVEMPGQNGYETCDQLRQINGFKQLPVIFISSAVSLKSKLQGYEAGGDDYVTKPWEPEIMLAKMEALTKHRAFEKSLESRAKVAESTAFLALTDNSEFGRVIQFAESCSNINSIESLMTKINLFLSNMGLISCTLIKFNNELKFFSSSGEVKPIESELMTLLLDQPRFYDFGSRTQVNFPLISLLIKNMPLHDREYYGRLKDLLPFLLSAADSKIFVLQSEEYLRLQTKSMLKSFEQIQVTFNEISNDATKNHQAADKISRKLLVKLDKELPALGLEDDQEKYLLDTVEQSVIAILNSTDAADNTRSSFKKIISVMEGLINTQAEQVNSLHKRHDFDDQHQANIAQANEIELF